jgi:hypothetical protein
MMEGINERTDADSLLLMVFGVFVISGGITIGLIAAAIKAIAK